MENNRPEYLYRGICIRYDELKDFVFCGIDMELPYDPYIDSQGKETVHDGNEYGIYMSDNPKVAEYAYGNATNNGDGTYIEPKVTIGNRGTEFIKIPAIGICYKISTQGLDIRKPWISSALQGVYNNGLKGDEWITDKIPAENYEILSVQIGKDLLHDEQYIDLNNTENIKEKTTQILEQRKARLEIFAQEMSKIPEHQRKEFGLGHLEILKEIYGENGFYYMENIDEIDTSSNTGMIRFLMANVYKNNAESIDFGTMLYLQDIKEKAEFMQKKGKEFDLKEHFTNNEKILEILEHKENGHINSNGKLNTVVVKQNQSADRKNEDTQNYVSEKDGDIIDYYEKYDIHRDEKWETIKDKLKKEQKKWMKRSSSTNEKEVLDEVFQHIDEISEALYLFKPGNEEKRKQYDSKLEQQKREQVMGEHSKGVFGDEQREDIIQSMSWSIPPGRIKLNDGTEIYKREFIEKFILSEEHIFSNTVDIEDLVQSALEGNVNKYVIDDAYIDHAFDEMAENMIIKNENTDYQFFLEGLDGIDLRDKFDLDGLSPEMFRYLLFDSRTVFSDIQMERFKPHELIEKGKNNEKTNLELNGKGTCAAILDKFSDVSTEEFGGKVVKYIIRNGKNGVEVVLDEGEKADGGTIYKGGQNDSFHGNTVASLLAGKECGIVPNTKVILFEVAKDEDKEDEIDPKTAKEAMLKFINSDNDINPDIISISNDTELTPDAKDIKDKLENKGCAYIDSSVFWKSFSWGRDNSDGTTLDPLIKKICENPKSSEGKISTIKEAIMKSIILPFTQRTSTHISIGQDGKKEIVEKYNGSFCGASFVIPQIAGLFLKARQVDKNISFDEFIEIARDTAKLNKDNMKYLDADGIITKVKEMEKGNRVGAKLEGAYSGRKTRRGQIQESSRNVRETIEKRENQEIDKGEQEYDE